MEIKFEDKHKALTDMGYTIAQEEDPISYEIYYKVSNESGEIPFDFNGKHGTAQVEWLFDKLYTDTLIQYVVDQNMIK